ncbi:hypothetical protein [Nocardiopsis lambiniae]|uniref:Uncharacterized protein n=1 Tax=Nocardiopsis lambiniae TaxID=3075539 RepID=A0ABU2M6E0_9ACTN|nr:hypothetical protein [Nocardiopsis sp. DSM 44743]MDT0328234.1 hypothetical protein [Nocardiopsis sp. DSM 44743]
MTAQPRLTETFRLFLITGRMGPVELGMTYEEIVGLWGEPEGFAHLPSEPIYCVYGHVNLGFTAERLLHLISFEPCQGIGVIPSAAGGLTELPVPTRVVDLVAILGRLGEPVVEREPHVRGHVWYEVTTSGVLIDKAEDDAGGAAEEAGLLGTVIAQDATLRWK